MTSSGNTVPMLLIPKPGSTKLRVVVDLCARNANTKKLSSPMPDIEGIKRHVARAKFRSIIDGKDAYEQIRIIPEHVSRTAVTIQRLKLMKLSKELLLQQQKFWKRYKILNIWHGLVLARFPKRFSALMKSGRTQSISSDALSSAPTSVSSRMLRKTFSMGNSFSG